MLYSEIIAVSSQIHTKHINTLFGQNVELLNVKRGGTYSNHWALEGYRTRLIEMTKDYLSASPSYIYIQYSMQQSPSY
jgi:hypothetical protein